MQLTNDQYGLSSNLSARENLAKTEVAEFVTVSDDNCFAGLDAYQKLSRHPDVDLATLSQPLTIEPIGIAVPAGDPLFSGLQRSFACGQHLL